MNHDEHSGLGRARLLGRFNASYRGCVRSVFRPVLYWVPGAAFVVLSACSGGGSEGGTERFTDEGSATMEEKLSTHAFEIRDCASLREWLAGPGAGFRNEVQTGTVRVQVQYVP